MHLPVSRAVLVATNNAGRAVLVAMLHVATVDAGGDSDDGRDIVATITAGGAGGAGGCRAVDDGGDFGGEVLVATVNARGAVLVAMPDDNGGKIQRRR